MSTTSMGKRYSNEKGSEAKANMELIQLKANHLEKDGYTILAHGIEPMSNGMLRAWVEYRHVH